MEEFGYSIDELQLTEVNYAPEIMQQMLIKQQAKAYIDARKEIVSGAVDIVKDIKKQMNLSSITSDKLTVNLLTVLSSDGVTPVIKME
jgi:DNA-binding ferritin-like protein